MPESLTEQLIRKLEEVAGLYYRLILVVAPAGAGKTSALQNLQERTGAPLVNVNLELSRKLLDLTGRQRALQIPRVLTQLLDELVSQTSSGVVLLDNIEILFDASLKQDSLRLLQGISRNITVVAAWSGLIKDNCVIYAVPEHPEYCRYPIKDFLMVTKEQST